MRMTHERGSQTEVAMSTVTEDRVGTAQTGAKPSMVFTSDSHVGPRLREDLRAYCPAKYLDDFDAFLADHEASLPEIREGLASHPNIGIDGHHDPEARFRDLDAEGVSGAVLFHGSQNGEPFPFSSFIGATGAGGRGASGMTLGIGTDTTRELSSVGHDIYNRWLGDFCSLQPERHVGLAFLPLWDIDAATAAVPRVRALGLTGINFPPPRPGLVEYNKREWDPFWAACVEHGMTLTTHANGGVPANYSGPGERTIFQFEVGGYFSVRGMWWMILGGVFERFPELKLVLTEVLEGWWGPTLYTLDTLFDLSGGSSDGELPRRPSEYASTNVFIGSSPMSRWIVADSVRDGWHRNLMFGSDYPHIEGSFRAGSDTSMTTMVLRHTLRDVDVQVAADVVGGNAVRAYGLDGAKLDAVAAHIGAPTLEELVTPPSADELDQDRLAREASVSFYSRPFYLRSPSAPLT